MTMDSERLRGSLVIVTIIVVAFVCLRHPYLGLQPKLPGRHPQDPEADPVGKIGLAFARALVASDSATAHRMLTASQRDELKPADLQAQYKDMTSYWTAPADRVSLNTVLDPRDFPDPEPNDIGWALVNIQSTLPNGSANLEMIMVRVVCEADENRIAEIEWGRP